MAAPPQLRRDQQRALGAYAWAEDARTRPDCNLDEYEIAVQSFAATMLRSGLAAAASLLERNADRAGFRLLLDQLAVYPLPGQEQNPAAWPKRVREIRDVRHYMRATREYAALLVWLRRACRAVQKQG